MAFDFTGDYRYFDGAATVTHTHASAGGATTTVVAGALKQAVRIQDQAGAWLISATQCLWRLPAALLSAAPADGDTIADGAEVWIVQADVTLDPLTGIYACACVKER